MSSERLRLFVAFEVPLEQRLHVQERIEPLKAVLPGARWTSVESQHVTLKFIGWFEASRAEEIVDVCGMVAAEHTPADLSLTHVGTFPSKTRVRVVWAGIDDPTGLSTRLKADLSERMEALGVEAEDRSFTPHLTLARLKAPRRVKEGELDVDIGPLMPFRLDEIVLFRSHLSPKGARYEAIHRCPLA